MPEPTRRKRLFGLVVDRLQPLHPATADFSDYPPGDVAITIWQGSPRLPICDGSLDRVVVELVDPNRQCPCVRHSSVRHVAATSIHIDHTGSAIVLGSLGRFRSLLDSCGADRLRGVIVHQVAFVPSS